MTLHQQLTVASDTQYEVTFDAVCGCAEATASGPPASGWGTWDAVMHDGCILLGAQAMGGAQHALDITVQYAKDREQFDKPLGAFQAIAHYLADAVTAVDGGTTLVHEAAWARAEGRPVDKLAPMAKLFACRTYRDVTAMAQQVFGGIGFTVEFDIQLYFRRAKAAPGVVVGHPLPRGARGLGRARPGAPESLAAPRAQADAVSRPRV